MSPGRGAAHPSYEGTRLPRSPVRVRPGPCQAPKIRCGDDRGAVHCGRARPACRRADRGRPRPGVGTARRAGLARSAGRRTRVPGGRRAVRVPDALRPGDVPRRLRPPRPRLRSGGARRVRGRPGLRRADRDRLRPDALPSADRRGAPVRRARLRPLRVGRRRAREGARRARAARGLQRLARARPGCGARARGRARPHLERAPRARSRARRPVRARLRQLGCARPLRVRRPRPRAATRDCPCVPRRCGAGARRLPLRGRRLRPALRHPARRCRSSGCSPSSRRSGHAASTMP